MEPFVNVFGEYRMTPQTRFTVTLENLFDVGGTRGRTFFEPDRTNPDPSLFEFRERKGHRAISVRVRHSFG
jgi:hypothetical protein